MFVRRPVIGGVIPIFVEARPVSDQLVGIPVAK
jgi:hypothetical protein